jgi:hypothetical protein
VADHSVGFVAADGDGDALLEVGLFREPGAEDLTVPELLPLNRSPSPHISENADATAGLLLDTTNGQAITDKGQDEEEMSGQTHASPTKFVNFLRVITASPRTAVSHHRDRSSPKQTPSLVSKGRQVQIVKGRYKSKVATVLGWKDKCTYEVELAEDGSKVGVRMTSVELSMIRRTI